MADNSNHYYVHEASFIVPQFQNQIKNCLIKITRLIFDLKISGRSFDDRVDQNRFSWVGVSQQVCISPRFRFKKLTKKKIFTQRMLRHADKRHFALFSKSMLNIEMRKTFVTDQNIGHTRAISLKRLYSCHIIPLAGRVKISIF